MKILAKFAMEFASHAYSALELSDSYVRFLRVSGRGDEDAPPPPRSRRRCSSSRGRSPPCRSEPETKDLLPKSKGILEKFQSCRPL